MYIDLIVWDPEDDPDGNTHHILGPGEVTIAEVEEVLRDHRGPFEYTHRTGLPAVFGRTSTGKYIIVVFEYEDDAGFIIVRPKSSYPVQERGD